MRAQHAFAAAGGARGEQNVADVVGLDRGSAAADRVEAYRFRASGDEVVPSRLLSLPGRSELARCAAVQAGRRGPGRRPGRRPGTDPFRTTPAPGCGPGYRWL